MATKHYLTGRLTLPAYFKAVLVMNALKFPINMFIFNFSIKKLYYKLQYVEGGRKISMGKPSGREEVGKDINTVSMS